MGKRKGGMGLAVAAAAGLYLAGSHAGHGHGGIPILDSFGSAPVHGGRQAVAYARDQLGCPYVWGGTGPCGSGFDCSGLAMDAWASAGVTIRRTSQDQWATLPHVGTPRPGDLVFFAGGDGTPSAPGHVGIVIGPHRMIEAYATGVPVRVSFFGTSGSPAGDQNPVGYADPGEH